MNFLKKFVNSFNYWPLLVVFVFGILASRSLIFENGYFNMHDDLQMMRQLEMEKCFLDGQIPCRWVPDMGYGYGFPLFNFYPPLPYLVGQVFRIFQFSFVDTVKLTFAVAFISSGITMYFLSKDFFGKWGGVVSSVFYIWAPYHSIDVYVRGAMNETWALTWFPLILWTSYNLIKVDISKSLKWMLGLSLGWAGLLLSHNLMVMIFLPVFISWCFIFWFKEQNWKKVLKFIYSGLFALGLSAFFTIPAILEQKYVHVDTLVKGYYEFIAHFASIRQLLFSRYWGYGASIWGPNDGMPFQIGQIHWILSLIILFVIVVGLVKRKLDIQNDSLATILFSIAIAWFAAFMAHQNSTFIWQIFKPLEFVQFPWRFLTLSILGFSIVSGSIVLLLKPYKKIRVIVPTVLLILLLIINWNYFSPQFGKMGPLTDQQKFTGVAWNMQRTAGILDYLPKTAEQNPKDQQGTLAIISKGSGQISDSIQGTNWAKFNVNLSNDSVIRINLYQFPNWQIKVDGSDVSAYIPEDEVYGRMFLNLSQGTHSVSMRLVNTPVRSVANTISLIFWSALLTCPLWKKKFFV